MFCANFIFQTHSSQKSWVLNLFTFIMMSLLSHIWWFWKDTFYFAVTIERCRFFSIIQFFLFQCPLYGSFIKDDILPLQVYRSPPLLRQTIPAQVLVILMPFYQEYNWILHTVPDKKCTLPQRYRKYFLEIHYDE